MNSATRLLLFFILIKIFLNLVLLTELLPSSLVKLEKGQLFDETQSCTKKI